MGFRIVETMEGTHTFTESFGGQEGLPFRFKAEWGPDDIKAWLNPKSETFLTQPLAGIITVGGLCEEAAMEGTLQLRYFKDKTIRYNFRFAVDGEEYRYMGEKVNILPHNLLTSHTTCFGTITRLSDDALVSRSISYFKLSTLPEFLLSFRLT